MIAYQTHRHKSKPAVAVIHITVCGNHPIFADFCEINGLDSDTARRLWRSSVSLALYIRTGSPRSHMYGLNRSVGRRDGCRHLRVWSWEVNIIHFGKTSVRTLWGLGSGSGFQQRSGLLSSFHIYHIWRLKKNSSLPTRDPLINVNRDLRSSLRSGEVRSPKCHAGTAAAGCSRCRTDWTSACVSGWLSLPSPGEAWRCTSCCSRSSRRAQTGHKEVNGRRSPDRVLN